MPDPTVPSDQNSLIYAAGSAIILLIAGAGATLKTLRQQRHTDSIHKDSSELFDQLQKTISRSEKRIDELTKRLDTMASERNAVMVENERLRGENARLTDQINVLREGQQRLEGELKAALAKIDDMEVRNGAWKPGDPDRRSRGAQ
ncbi:cell division protein ZapB [Azospirillum sp. TSO5]|uniref:cell division protein ZapB n=1 Tax=Azospirillum sp. TSO5 TaxID=716760 RepID=UPI000D61A700|nr:cell division protein ZapB [Azospirillum sp. TSO5]PWC95457.1 hypothetical protein TSO5_10560 [Azospirillum sp. TSO5]